MKSAATVDKEQALAESVRVAEDAAAKAAEECAGLRTRIAEQDTAATKYEYAVQQAEVRERGVSSRLEEAIEEKKKAVANAEQRIVRAEAQVAKFLSNLVKYLLNLTKAKIIVFY